MRVLAMLSGIFLWFGLIAECCAASTSNQAANTGAFPPEIRKILSQPEDKIDTGLAALAFAKEIYPGINVATYSMRIDALAVEAKQTIDRYGKYDPDSVIRALNSYYYRVYRVQYDKSPNGRAKQENYFINGILDTRKGQCITLPMLYMSIAQRLGYPVYSVMAPEHTFLRFVDPALKEQNIDLSSGAGYSPDKDYAYKLNISPRGIKSGAYLRTLTRRQYLGVLLMQNGIVFSSRGEIDRAIMYFEKAYEIDPKNVYFAKNLEGLWLRKLNEASSAELAGKYQENYNNFRVLSEKLGWVSDPDANTRRRKG